MNSKYREGKKPNLNTFIRQAPPSLRKDSWFSLSLEFTSVCSVCDLLSADSGFWLQTLILVSSASQLFKVPIGHCHYLVFQCSPQTLCPYTDSPTWERLASLTASFLQENAGATKGEWYCDGFREPLKMQQTCPRPQRGPCGLVYL